MAQTGLEPRSQAPGQPYGCPACATKLSVHAGTEKVKAFPALKILGFQSQLRILPQQGDYMPEVLLMK